MTAPTSSTPKQDLERQIREMYGLIREYENILSESSDPAERRRARRGAERRWQLMGEWLQEYRRLCERLGEPMAEDIRQLIVLRLGGEMGEKLTPTIEVPSPSPPPETPLPEVVTIPAGPFWMGSPPDDAEAAENEKPRRREVLPTYAIGRYPVTNAEYAAFVQATDHRPPEHWPDGRVPPGLQDHPVVYVSHEDAEAYCRWLSRVTGRFYRLPTEGEWEKAARGPWPEARRYPWGDEWRPDFCNTREAGREGTTPVHQFEGVNRSPFGVVDLAGNVWEWTSSWYERYPGSTYESLHFGRDYRVVRGGSWRNGRGEARISCRGRYKPGVRRPYLGFRVVLELPDHH